MGYLIVRFLCKINIITVPLVRLRLCQPWPLRWASVDISRLSGLTKMENNPRSCPWPTFNSLWYIIHSRGEPWLRLTLLLSFYSFNCNRANMMNINGEAWLRMLPGKSNQRKCKWLFLTTRNNWTVSNTDRLFGEFFMFIRGKKLFDSI